MEIGKFIKLIDLRFKNHFINRGFFIFYLMDYLDFDYVKIIYALAKGSKGWLAKDYLMQKLNQIKDNIQKVHLDLIANDLLSSENYVYYLFLKGEDK